MSSPSGYTLLEVVVTVVILGIMAALLARGYPAWRSHQQLIQAEQIIQNAFRDAQQQALQEIRDEDCVIQFTDYDSQRHCSDIGLWMEAGSHEIKYFADTHDPDNDTYSADDHIISSIQISPSLTFSENRSFVFQSIGPSQMLYFGDPGIQVIGAHSAVVALSQEPGSRMITFNVGPYGQVSRQ